MGRMMKDIDPTLMAQIEKEGLGAFLRREREKKDVTLRSISEHTRIRTYYLENIESGDFDRLPTGPVGLGFIRAFADAIGVDSRAVAESYKREIADDAPAEEFGFAPETTSSFSPSPRTNRFSSVATFVFVLIFLLAGGGLLWFMKGRTEQLVPVGSIVGRIKTAVAPVADKLPRLDGMSEKAKNEGGAGQGGGAVEEKAPGQGRPPVSTVNSKDPPVSEESGQKKPPVQSGDPAPETPGVAATPPAQGSPTARAQDGSAVQANAPLRETPVAREEPLPPENPAASSNPSIQASAPVANEVAREGVSNGQATPQGQQTPAAIARSDLGAPPLTLKVFATEGHVAANRDRCEKQGRTPFVGGQGEKLGSVGKIHPYRGERGGHPDIPERLANRIAQGFFQRAQRFHHHQEVFELRFFPKIRMPYGTPRRALSPDVRFDI